MPTVGMMISQISSTVSTRLATTALEQGGQLHGWSSLHWTAFLLCYMAPTIIATVRRKSHLGKGALMNFLLGWTIVIWVVLLVKALRPKPTTSDHPGRSYAHAENSGQSDGSTNHYPTNDNRPREGSVPPGWYPTGSVDGLRLWDGGRWGMRASDYPTGGPAR